MRKKDRKVGDDFHEHLEAMMYETEEDEEMEMEAQSQPVMNNYSKVSIILFNYFYLLFFEQPVHHFSTQPPNIIVTYCAILHLQ